MAEHSGFQKLVAEAKKHITEVSPQDAAAKLNSGDAVVVDVRDKDEWDEGHIPGATHMSRGTIELDIEEKVPDPNAMIICHCGGGGRSALAHPRVTALSTASVERKESVSGTSFQVCSIAIALVKPSIACLLAQ